MRDTQITVVGNLAADPVRRQIDGNRFMTTFRIASTSRRLRDGEWADGDTSWWDVCAFGVLGENAASSLVKGQRVLVNGRASVEQWSSRGENGEERSGTRARVTADALGHDLTYGTSAFVRVVRASEATSPSGPSGADVASALGARIDADGVLVDGGADEDWAAGGSSSGADRAGEPVAA